MTIADNHLSLTAHRLLEATARNTGEDLFVAIARAISEAFGVRWAFVGELISPTRVRTRAGWTEGAPMAPIEYDLEGTPCAEVIWQDACGYPSGVQEAFPDDHMLVEMGAQSYFGVPVFGSRGKPIGLMVALHDQPLHIDHYLDLLNLFALRIGAEFERERAERLMRQNERLESLGMLAGGVAHDFNNLLTAILANVGLARLHLQRGSGADAIGLLGEIEKAVGAATGLTRQLQAYSSRSPIQSHPVDFAALVRETAKMMQPLLPAQAHLSLDVPEDLPLALGDMTQLRQVVMNLLRNAGDALNGQGRAIRMQTAVVPAFALGYDAINYQAENFAPERPHLALTVTDDGCGMTTEVQARMFTPLFTTKPTGHGLGMAITAGILGKHRGAIAVRSAPGLGTAITVYLPIVAACATAADELAPFAGARVLVADDEPRVRATMTRALTALGCEVIEANDGTEALNVLRRRPQSVDCALLDLLMPGFGGDEVALAMHGDAKRVPIVLTSGQLPDEMLDHLRSGTIAAVLAKPWTRADLVAALRAALPARAAAPGRSVT